MTVMDPATAMNGAAVPGPGPADAKRSFSGNTGAAPKARPRGGSRRKNQSAEDDDPSKRRCVSTACIACRKRKSKCDGNLPACAACSQVYGTECIYSPQSDHRRKGVYKNDIDNLKTRDSTLQTLIQAILNYPEDDVPALVRDIRTCESLDTVAEKIVAKQNGLDDQVDDEEGESPAYNDQSQRALTFESSLYGKMGDLRLDEGSIRYIGGTSNLIHLAQEERRSTDMDEYPQQENAITSWTEVTKDAELITHLLNMYFTWHYTFFTTLSKQLFFRDFYLGRPPNDSWRATQYCTPVLVNAILALGCHFTSNPGARDDPEDSATAGDHFFREAKRLIMANDEHEKPHLTTVQALALMSVREAGCGREGKGWVYSGMSFRMSLDMGLNLESSHLTASGDITVDEYEEDVRRVTFWGGYLFDKCWSNYLGRLPQLPSSIVAVPKFDVFPEEEASQWSPYTDSGFSTAHEQPARTRAVALEISKLCEISNDLMSHFYNPTDIEKTKGKAAELRKLSDIHTRLESWRRELPKEMEPREGGLSSVLVMHMFFQLLFIHLFRPFLKYTQATSPLPSTVSPRKLCTQAAAMISKLMRLYKRSHGLRQICNIAVYIAHSACTIHLLNLPDKHARRDIVHGVKHLEEIAEGWLGARRTLAILSMLARKWNVDIPEDAAVVLARTDAKFGPFHGDALSPSSQRRQSVPTSPPPFTKPPQQTPVNVVAGNSSMADSRPTPAPNVTTTNINPVAQPDPFAHQQTYPLDLNALQAQQYQAVAAPVPATPHARSWSNRNRRPEGTSPSDMFGGVEQLIRDSQDWTYQDQAQLATGFENWSGGMDTANWTNSTPANILAHDGMNGMPARSGPPPSLQSMSPQSNGRYAVPANGNNASVEAMANWLNSMNAYNSMAASYNEDEWYQ